MDSGDEGKAETGGKNIRRFPVLFDFFLVPSLRACACKDNRDRIKAPDPVAKDLISNKLEKK